MVLLVFIIFELDGVVDYNMGSFYFDVFLESTPNVNNDEVCKKK